MMSTVEPMVPSYASDGENELEIGSVIERVFLAHPRNVRESYCRHASIAMSFGAKMVMAGAKCMIHAVIPSAFQTSASDVVRALHRELEARRPQDATQCRDYVI